MNALGREKSTTHLSTKESDVGRASQLKKFWSSDLIRTWVQKVMLGNFCPSLIIWKTDVTEVMMQSVSVVRLCSMLIFIRMLRYCSWRGDTNDAVLSTMFQLSTYNKKSKAIVLNDRHLHCHVYISEYTC